MQFLTVVKVFDTRAGKQADQELREALGTRVQELMATGKVQEAGFLGGMRGLFFLLEIESSEDLYGLLGPEIYGNCTVQAYPVIPLEKGAALFQQWAEEGR